jgi:hypothetical protein
LHVINDDRVLFQAKIVTPTMNKQGEKKSFFIDEEKQLVKSFLYIWQDAHVGNS